MTETVLILGGTAEARALSRALSERWTDWRVITSLAGRTNAPSAPEGELRSGGFGGVEGLAAYLESELVTLLIDATHPYADEISASAAAAAGRIGIPRLVLHRPPWPIEPHWRCIPNLAALDTALIPRNQRLFLAVGRQDVDAVAELVGDEIANRFWLLRFVDGPAGPGPWPNSQVVAGTPGTLSEELALLASNSIDTVITKNSGGDRSHTKLEAAKKLGCDVVVIDRPTAPPPPYTANIDDAISWITQNYLIL